MSNLAELQEIVDRERFTVPTCLHRELRRVRGDLDRVVPGFRSVVDPIETPEGRLPAGSFRWDPTGTIKNPSDSDVLMQEALSTIGRWRCLARTVDRCAGCPL